MTLTIKLTPEQEARLAERARQEGKPVEDYLRGVIAQLAEPDRDERTPEEKRAAVHRALVQAGLVRDVKRPPLDLKTYREFEPVPITGKPLSETIIEERR
jgi:hypothetical protein